MADMACVVCFYVFHYLQSSLKKGDAIGPGRIRSKELWVDKYRPTTIEELAVHKKKVKRFIVSHQKLGGHLACNDLLFMCVCRWRR